MSVINRRKLAVTGLLAISLAMPPPACGMEPGELPDVVKRALQRAGVRDSGYAVLVTEPGATVADIEHAADMPFNPASTMKLLTTLAALDILGTGFRFHTDIHTTGRLRKGVLEGDLIIRGGNDPSLSYERLRELVKRLRKRGIREIRGDVLVDRSLYAARAAEQTGFFAERENPLNAPPDSLVVQHKVVVVKLVPDARDQRVAVSLEPALPVVRHGGDVALGAGPCPPDWKDRMPVRVRGESGATVIDLAGELAAACGPRAVTISVLDHAVYFAAAFTQLWRQEGGTLGGSLKPVETLPRRAPLFEIFESPPLLQIVREINKSSNNMMARQLFIHLGTTAADPAPPVAADTAGGVSLTAPQRKPRPPSEAEQRALIDQRPRLLAARAGERISRWLFESKIDMPGLVMENGAGLSAIERVSARGMARLLKHALSRPYAREFVESLPLAGLDGTMRQRLKSSDVAGMARLKTGTLSEVRAIAGYVRDARDRLYIVVFMVNSRNAGSAVVAIDQTVEWLYRRGREPLDARDPR